MQSIPGVDPLATAVTGGFPAVKCGNTAVPGMYCLARRGGGLRQRCKSPIYLKSNYLPWYGRCISRYSESEAAR